MELVGKNTVVTGAANGIGKAVAQEFHKQGARVVLADRDKNLLDEEWDKVMSRLSGQGRLRLTNEEEEIIRKIANRL
jgi:NAD(P)-dependent dehydrogenase (short-subunit alcohol dehydrogenase family)